MGNESFLAFTTAHLPLTEQNLARYKLRIVEPPKLPLEKKPNADEDGPDIEPNLWMWVNPNVVYPPGKLEVVDSKKGEELMNELPSPQSPLKEEDASCSEVSRAESLLHSSSEQSPPRKQFTSSPSTWELPEEEEAKDQDDSSSVALPSPHTRAPLQSRRLRQAISPEGRLWSRPPLNYFHLIALALRNSPPCGLNVQQIYSFTRPSPEREEKKNLGLGGSDLDQKKGGPPKPCIRRRFCHMLKQQRAMPGLLAIIHLEKRQHFPFFRTAPEGWKNTVRHNLCFRDSFEKVPVSMQGEASTRPRSCLWKLTEEGHRRFAEEARALASTRLESIQQCMSQPDVMPFLFDLEF